MKRYDSVDGYIDGHPEYQEALTLMREYLLQTRLEEGVKWGAPAYMVNGKNVIGIGAFKSYVGLWFHQGSFLSDPAKKLINAQEGKTKGLRQWRFESADEVKASRDLILSYAEEAIQNQLDGKVVKVERKAGVAIPEQLQKELDSDATLAERFASFTPGKQREFANHVAEAKREETKLKRIDKIKPMILDGVGLNDKYRNC